MYSPELSEVVKDFLYFDFPAHCGASLQLLDIQHLWYLLGHSYKFFMDTAMVPYYH